MLYFEEIDYNNLSRDELIAELKEYDRKFRTLLTKGKFITVFLDIKGTITFANDYLLELTNRKREDVIGKNWFESFIPENRRRQIQNVHSNVTQEGITDFLSYVENEVFTASGKRVMIGWTNTVIRNREGIIVGTCSIGKELAQQSDSSEPIASSSSGSSLRSSTGPVTPSTTTQTPPTAPNPMMENLEGFVQVGEYCYFDDPSHSIDNVKIGFNMFTNEKVAIKVIKKENMEPKDFERARREIYILQQLTRLNHPYIARILHWEEHPTLWYIVMEYVSGGELLQHILKTKRLEEAEAQRLFRQVLQAVKCCHDNNIIHRDLKHNNIMLDENKNIKLIDFGLSNFAEGGVLRSTFCGSPAYVCPEILQGKEYSGYQADIWSLGVILFSMLTGEFPFKTIADIVTVQWPRHPYLTPGPLDIFSRIFVDYKSRITLDALLSHEWINMELALPASSIQDPTSLPGAISLKRSMEAEDADLSSKKQKQNPQGEDFPTK